MLAADLQSAARPPDYKSGGSKKVGKTFEELLSIIVVPVWDIVEGSGNNVLYRVVAFALIRVTDYHLARENRISARFLGLVTCN